MSAVEALRLARENGIRLAVAGDDLILDADRKPSPRVLEEIRRHKAGIVVLLTVPEGDWMAEDWRLVSAPCQSMSLAGGGPPPPPARPDPVILARGQQ